MNGPGLYFRTTASDFLDFESRLEQGISASEMLATTIDRHMASFSVTSLVLPAQGGTQSAPDAGVALGREAEVLGRSGGPQLERATRDNVDLDEAVDAVATRRPDSVPVWLEYNNEHSLTAGMKASDPGGMSQLEGGMVQTSAAADKRGNASDVGTSSALKNSCADEKLPLNEGPLAPIRPTALEARRNRETTRRCYRERKASYTELQVNLNAARAAVSKLKNREMTLRWENAELKPLLASGSSRIVKFGGQ